MTQQKAKERIKKSVESCKHLKQESQEIKDYFANIIWLTFWNFEQDRDDIHTSTQNLSFAIEICLFDDFAMILEEARAETQK